MKFSSRIFRSIYRTVAGNSPNTKKGARNPHRLPPLENPTKLTDGNFDKFMRNMSGGITTDEAKFLAHHAKNCISGCIVEIGSFRGKSSVALAFGAAKNHRNDLMVYCVDPQQDFTGIYGGVFGAEDRKEFYRAMIASGCYKNAALINLPSEQVSQSWKLPIGFLFIDGDHSYDAVKKDFENWYPHVENGGKILFDDSKNPKIGPHQLIQEIKKNSDFLVEESVGKFTIVKKQDSSSATKKRIEILVVCEKLVSRGGLLRFERIRPLMENRNFSLTFAVKYPEKENNFFERNCVVNFETAKQKVWDVTMVPGAGFSEEFVTELSSLATDNFGKRIQHILKDRSRYDAFLNVNKAFKPDVVVFNNHHWEPGTYTKFQANQFFHLVGAVDTDYFSKIASKTPSSSEFVIGGLATKNPLPLVRAVSGLPDRFKLKLFGNISGPQRQKLEKIISTDRLEFVGPIPPESLDSFYSKVDAVVSTEESAGWSNMCAEAMASHVPVICTSAGTVDFAFDEKTALILKEATELDIRQNIVRLADDEKLRKRLVKKAHAEISNFDWSSYCSGLIEIINRDNANHYYRNEELGLYGKWGTEERFEGLDYLFENVSNKSVLDLGAAEGLVSLRSLENGAALVHGFEFDSDRVMTANALLEVCENKNWKFQQADLSNWDTFAESKSDTLLSSYDVVLYLGLHQHLPKSERIGVLNGALDKAGTIFAIRTPHKVFTGDDILKRIQNKGFEEIPNPDTDFSDRHLGPVKIYKRSVAV